MTGLTAAHGPNGSLFNLVARFLIGGCYFVIPGIYILFHPESAQQYATELGARVPEGMVVAIAIVALVGGVSVLTGCWCRLMSVLLIALLLVLLTYAILFESEGERNPYVFQTTLVRSAVVCGGLLLLIVVGGRRYSFSGGEPDWLHGKRAERWIGLTGRVLIGGAFLMGALWRLVGWGCQNLLLESLKVGAPALALLVLVALEIAGGVMVVLGRNHQLGSLLLSLYTLQALFLLHWFWSPALESVTAPAVYCSASTSLISATQAADPLLRMRLEFGYLGILGALLLYFSCERGISYRCKEVVW